VSRRVGAAKEVFVLVNHTKTPQHVTLPRPMQRVLHDGAITSVIDLPPRDVEVLVGQASRPARVLQDPL